MIAAKLSNIDKARTAGRHHPGLDRHSGGSL